MTGSKYAGSTTVSRERSRSELERILTKYGARGFAYAWDDTEGKEREAVSFKLADRTIRFNLPLPDRTARDVMFTPTGLRRTPSSQKAMYDQLVKQKWRALVLVVKAKLEAIESGITSAEEEFFAQTVTPDGSTIYEQIRPQLDSYQSGRPLQLNRMIEQ